MSKYRTEDGLVSSNNLDVIERWNMASYERDIKLNIRNRYLRSIGIKAFHPDDGWVDRERNSVILAYPYFEDKNIKVGDKIALGFSDSSYRVVRVIKIRHGFCSNAFYFKPVFRNKKKRSAFNKIHIKLNVVLRKLKMK